VSNKPGRFITVFTAACNCTTILMKVVMILMEPGIGLVPEIVMKGFWRLVLLYWLYCRERVE
jgi:hypothetical protein